MVSKINQEQHSAHTYLRRTKKFPNVWCPGCGIGIVMSGLIRAIDRMGLEKDNVALISGIGCTGRMPVYMDFNTMHTTHGRALAFATGLKLAQPDLKVIVIMGDGDALAIGGNHFIHAARRNMDLTAIVVNNNIYGMTGGQYSPTTPLDSRSSTSIYGNIEPPMPVSSLAIAAGASFVASTTVYHAVEMDRFMEQAIGRDGFNLVEVASYCHTTYGRMNKLGSAVEMMRALKDSSVTLAAAEKLSEEEREGRIVRGVLCDHKRPGYIERYNRLLETAMAQAEKEKAA
jgi:2-oxoglutarate/2-oxoacid ferredoxin oxidoreductase subunit beta